MIGSFLNVVIVRTPNNASIILPPSHCPLCKNHLKWFHNIPIFSYIFLKGKCAFCQEKISIIYPIVELSTSIISIIIYLKYGINFFSITVFILFALLIALAFIDLIHLAVPDSVNFLALFVALMSGYFTLETFQNMLIISGFLSLIRMFIGFLLKKEAMGEADIILGATMGAFLGIKGALIALFFASLIAIIPALIRRKKGLEETPFIPFLTFGIVISFFYQADIIFWLKL